MARFFYFTIFCLLLAACGTTPTLPTVIPASTIEGTATNTLPPSAQPIAQSPAQPAFIRIVHAAPQTNAVNISLGRFVVASHLAFGVGTAQTEIDAGDYTLRVAASDAASDSAPLYETEFSLAANASLIVVFTGTADALTVVTYPEPNEPLRANEASVRAIHAVPRGVDFTLQPVNTDLTTAAVAFGQMTSALVLTPAQTLFTFQAGANPLLNFQLRLRENYSYVLVLVGSGDDASTLNVIVLENQVPGLTNIRPIHMAVDVPVVDFYLDGSLLGNAVDYARAGERLETAGGIRTVAIYAAGADVTTTTPRLSQSINLQPHTTLSLILLGTLPNLQLLSFVEDLSPTPAGQLRLGLINTMADAPVARVIDYYNTYADVYYGRQGSDITLNAGAYTLFWNTIEGVNSGTTVESSADLQFEAGRYYLYFMTGRAPADAPIILSENVGLESEVAAKPMGQARFVNAVPDGSIVDFLVDGNVVVSGLAYGQASALVDVPAALSDGPIQGSIVTIRRTGAANGTITGDYAFDLFTHHTIIAAGDTLEFAQVYGFADSFTRETGTASVRLLNISASSIVQLGLAYTLETVAPQPAAVPTEIVVDEQTTFRYTLPGGSQVALQLVTNRTALDRLINTVAVPIGIRDLYILDSTAQQVAAYVSSLLLEANMHYDIVAFQASNSPLVRAFVLTYPLIEP